MTPVDVKGSVEERVELMLALSMLAVDDGTVIVLGFFCSKGFFVQAVVVSIDVVAAVVACSADVVAVICVVEDELASVLSRYQETTIKVSIVTGRVFLL